jgi:hypothetical protein
MRFRRLIPFALMCLGIDTEHQLRHIEQSDPQVLAYIPGTAKIKTRLHDASRFLQP